MSDFIRFINVKDGTSNEISILVENFEIPVDCHEPILHVISEESDRFYESEMHLLYVNDSYTLHNETGPAYIVKRYDKIQYSFFNNGINVPIENLPCDDEVKLILKLKYGDNQSIFDYMYIHHNSDI